MNRAELREIFTASRGYALPTEIEAAAGGSALSAAALRLLGTLVERDQPRLVLEFGCGLSTLFLAELLRGTPGASLLSVENLPRFLEETRSRLPPGAPVTLASAPIRRYLFRGRLFATYDGGYRVELPRDRPLDLVLIDGPYGRFFGREAPLFQVAGHLSDETVIVLDDANRPREQRAIASWRAVWGDRLQLAHLPELGLAVARIIAASRQRRCPFGFWELAAGPLEVERSLHAWRRYRRAKAL